MRSPLIEVNGKKYMSTKAAAELWGVTARTVRDYCNKNKISDKFKIGNGQWYISIDEMKPLSKEDIRKFLVLSLQLKNSPTSKFDRSIQQGDSASFSRIYMQLYCRGYIKKFSVSDPDRLPYEIELTQKGMEIATTPSPKQKQNIVETLVQWLPIIIAAAQLVFK